MKRLTLFIALLVFIVSTKAFATPIQLTLESYLPAQLQTVSTIIDVSDPNDQLEISRLAALFALSPEGWNLQSLVDIGNATYTGLPEWEGGLIFQGVPRWTADFYEILIHTLPPGSPTIADVLGYELNEEALTIIDPVLGGSANYQLIFHTDAWVQRGSHDIGETPNNYGVISGGMNGTWTQTPVPNWGSFSVSTSVPDASVMLLLGSSLIGLVGIKKKIKKLSKPKHRKLGRKK